MTDQSTEKIIQAIETYGIPLMKFYLIASLVGVLITAAVSVIAVIHIIRTYSKLKDSAKKTCAGCEHLNRGELYTTNPPQYKCEKYGCLVRITDKCKKE
jgi:hypothetical protein